MVKTYTEEKGFVPEGEIETLADIQRIVTALPSFPFLVSCHHLADAFDCYRGLTAVRGHFMSPGWNHSWLRTPDGNIIDVYPWAQLGGPVLLCTKFFSPWQHAFISDKNPPILTPEYQMELEQIKEEIRRYQVNPLQNQAIR